MRQVVVLPLTPYSQPSGPQVRWFDMAWASSMPKPVSRTFGIAIGHVVAVCIRIEEQVGRIEDVHAAVAELDAGGEVQAVDEILRRVGAAVAVGVFEDRDAVGAARAARRWFRHAVVFGARPAVDFHALEAGRVRILQVLDRPQPAAVVAFHEDRLPDHRLAGEECCLESLGDGHPLCGFLGRETLRERRAV